MLTSGVPVRGLGHKVGNKHRFRFQAERWVREAGLGLLKCFKSTNKIRPQIWGRGRAPWLV